MTDWRRYDREDKDGTAPASDELVWIWEHFHSGADPGPQIGYFDGHCWRMWWGADDCDVTHWADMNYPDDAPEGIDDGQG